MQSESSLDTIPDHLTLSQFFLDVAHPERPVVDGGVPCLVDDATGRNISLDTLRTRTNNLANAFHTRWNIGKGDVVCILGPNHVDYLVVVLAVHKLGGIITALDCSFSTKEDLVSSLKMTASSFLVIHSDYLAAGLAAGLEAQIPAHRVATFEPLDCTQAPIVATHPTLEELIDQGAQLEGLQFQELQLNKGKAHHQTAFLSFSSGASGTSKAVPVSHYAVIANVIQRATHILSPTPFEEKLFRPGDVSVAVIPFCHIFGITNLLFMLFCGLSTVVVRRFDFQGILKSIIRYRINHLFLVPAHTVLLCKNPITNTYDLSCVRTCLVGSGPLTAEQSKELSRVVPTATLIRSYGLTEAGSTVSMSSPSQTSIPGSTGRVLPGISTRVVKEDGSAAVHGELGELWVTGPAMASEYSNNPVATKEVFTDGWVRTGDKAFFDINGELHIVDRLKDIFKVRGFQVSPAELETWLLQHDSISDVCVVGAPDEYSGEVPVAYVVVSPTIASRVKADASEAKKLKISILKHVAHTKAAYKWLAGGVVFVESLPRNPHNGKLLRWKLRERACEARSSAAK